MATSGVITFNQTAEELAKDILSMLNCWTIGEDLESEDYQFIERAINRLLKRMQGKGIPVWKYREAYLFPDTTNTDYVIGTAHMTDSAVLTEVATAAASTDTTLVLDSTTGMTAADNIGVELDDGTRQWTTIASITNGTTLELTDPLTDDVAVDNTVYTYTTKSSWTRHISNIRNYDYSSGIESPALCRRTRDEWNDLPDKSVSSIPTDFFYDKGTNQTGTIHTWPKMDNIKDYFKITYQAEIEDVTALTETVDIPAEYLDYIIYKVAVNIAPAKRVKATDELRALAAEAEVDARRLNDEVEKMEMYYSDQY